MISLLPLLEPRTACPRPRDGNMPVGNTPVGNTPVPCVRQTETAQPVSGRWLVELLLEEQQQLTAVEAFAANADHWHQARAARYQALLPAAPPQPGEQYAFEVDLDRCSGCKACVTACHSLNGLDETETWRDVGLLIGDSRKGAVMQHVTTACHHCLEPACLSACPVNAYEKDPVTGIVRHLDDQCFGCQYCTLACPYDAPKYHAAKGIVRKCDMCSSRLQAGEAPACVQACPHEAISIRVVSQIQVREDAEGANILPGAPDQHITLPTTNYKTAKALPRNLLPADYFRVGPQHAHWPLVTMLVLTQLSVGAVVAGLLLSWLLPRQQAAALCPLLSVNSLAFGLLAMLSSLLHLGRPQFAYRAVLGLRHSWLSREILAFGLFAGLSSAYAAANLWLAADTALAKWLGIASSATGIVAVFCSVMIYAFTRRECWSRWRVAMRFALTSAVLGVAAVWLSVLILSLVHPSTALSDLVAEHTGDLCRALLLLASVKLLWESTILFHLWPHRLTPLKRSALLLIGPLGSVTLARFAVGILGGIVTPILLLDGLAGGGQNLLAFTLVTGMLFGACLIGELLERYLFFTACAAPRMPGAIG